MVTTYRLEAVNPSDRDGNMWVHLINPIQGQENLLPLLWFTKSVNPNTKVLFDWKQPYNFAFWESGTLQPGVHLHAKDVKQTDSPKFNFQPQPQRWFTMDENLLCNANDYPK